MASVMAIVSKAVFEKQARGIGEGDVWPTDRYASKGKLLETLAEGGSLFLVTVRPPEELWLVAVLDQPEHDGDAWTATANTTPIRAIGKLVGKLVLHNGNGLTFEKGKLAMSLQGPRVLADSDVALLRGAAKTSSTSAKVAKASAAKPAAKVSVQPKKVSAATVAKATMVSAAKLSAAKVSVARPKAGAVSLDKVYAALDNGKPDEALRQLLALWKTARSPVLAEAIDVLSARIGSPIEGDSQDALVRAWNKVEKAGNPTDLGTLLAQIRAGADKNGVHTRLTKLHRRHAGDPRLASFIHTQLTELAFTASSSIGVWNLMFEVLEGIPDPRTVGVVAATRKLWDGKIAKRSYHDRFLADMDRLAEVASTLVVPEVSRAAVAPIFEYGKPVQTDDDRTLAELFAEVYRNPDDDHVRSVLADALVEKGDPRGELIHLQLRKDKLSAGEQRRVRELVTEHGRDWLGALGEYVSKNDLVYERGFASRIALASPRGKHPALPDVPEMSTIETLELGGGFTHQGGRDLWQLKEGVKEWIRRFARVRRLEIGRRSELEQLVADGPVPYTEVVVANPTKQPWFTRKNFPNLERVILPSDKGRIEVAKDWTFKKTRKR